MGQQQLILLALAVVIVGGAIVVGIRAFAENNIKNNLDVMMQDAVRISNDMQAWKQKPAPFGGQAAQSACAPTCLSDPADFTGATFSLLGYRIDPDGFYRNLNGEFQIVGQGATGTARIVAQNPSLDTQIVVCINGLSDTDITGVMSCMGGTQPDGTTPCPIAPGVTTSGAYVMRSTCYALDATGLAPGATCVVVDT